MTVLRLAHMAKRVSEETSAAPAVTLHTCLAYCHKSMSTSVNVVLHFTSLGIAAHRLPCLVPSYLGAIPHLLGPLLTIQTFSV